MPLTALAYLLVFALLLVLALMRPAWGVALYFLTFFLAPAFWWWGESLEAIRWNLTAGIVLLVSVLISGALSDRGLTSHSKTRTLCWLLLLTVINATIVHFALAPYLEISFNRYNILVKSMVLIPLIVFSIRSEYDLKIVVLAIILGSSYLGYEVTINDRGNLSGGRLEGVGVANASSANDLACLMVATLPLLGPFFLYGGAAGKLITVFSGPLVINVLLLCNSRGAFLSAIISALVYIFFAPRGVRRQVIFISLIGVFMAWMLLGDPRIFERFLTTFVDSEVRDESAASRLEFWQAGLRMVADHPLGSGGDSFKSVYGARYIAGITGIEEARSVHQGYINEACDWGIQGLVLRTSILIYGFVSAVYTCRRALAKQRWFLATTLLSVVASLAGVLVQSLFGTFLDVEWTLWLVGLAIACDRLSEHTELGEGALGPNIVQVARGLELGRHNATTAVNDGISPEST